MARYLLLIPLLSIWLSGCIAEPMRPGPNVTGGPTQLRDVSTREASALNALRAQYGRAALDTNAVLAAVARGHAEDMIANSFFGHVSSDGRTIVERSRGGGYDFCHVAENLAMGQISFEQVMQQWLGSPAHRRNLLENDVTEFGLVRAPGNLWVLVLGRPGC